MKRSPQRVTVILVICLIGAVTYHVTTNLGDGGDKRGEDSVPRERGKAVSVTDGAISHLIHRDAAIRIGGSVKAKQASQPLDQEAAAVAHAHQVSRAHRIPLRVDSTTIFYNRVPKCGTKAIQRVLAELSKQSYLNFRISHNFKERRPPDVDLKKLAKTFSNFRGFLLYDRLVYFVNFTRLGYPMPHYINLIREPVERLVSRYYYDLNGRIAIPFSNKKGFENLTLDECISLPLNTGQCPDLNKFWNEAVEFFCGQPLLCQSRDEQSLAIAKANIERYYSVVGLHEYMSSFFKVLEALWPARFPKADEIYNRLNLEMKGMYASKGKIPPSIQTLELLKTKSSLEYDLYFFVRKRFKDQYASFYRVQPSKDT